MKESPEVCATSGLFAVRRGGERGRGLENSPFRTPDGSASWGGSPLQRGVDCPGVGAHLEGSRPFEGARKAKVALAAGAGDKEGRVRWGSRSARLPECLPGRRWGRGARLPACFEFAHTSFLSDESSGRGKAGAAWGWPPHGAPPSNPRRQPRCVSARRFPTRSAFRKSRRFGSGRLAMTRSALADAH